MLAQLSVEYFARSPVLAWPVVALAIFICVFVAVSARALLGRREDMQAMAALPLADTEVERHG